MLYAKWHPFCHGLNVLIIQPIQQTSSVFVKVFYFILYLMPPKDAPEVKLASDIPDLD